MANDNPTPNIIKKYFKGWGPCPFLNLKIIKAENVVPATPKSATIILTALFSNHAEKNWLTEYWSTNIDDNIANNIGDNIKITHGQFNGLEGELVEKRNNKVIINLISLSIQLIIRVD